ncbi:hypothetical protein ACJX0J_041276, partial [Zea mays]
MDLENEFMFQFQVYLLMNKEAKGYRHTQLKEEEVAYDAAKEMYEYPVRLVLMIQQLNSFLLSIESSLLSLFSLGVALLTGNIKILFLVIHGEDWVSYNNVIHGEDLLDALGLWLSIYTNPYNSRHMVLVFILVIGHVFGGGGGILLGSEVLNIVASYFLYLPQLACMFIWSLFLERFFFALGTNQIVQHYKKWFISFVQIFVIIYDIVTFINHTCIYLPSKTNSNNGLSHPILKTKLYMYGQN